MDDALEATVRMERGDSAEYGRVQIESFFDKVMSFEKSQQQRIRKLI